MGLTVCEPTTIIAVATAVTAAGTVYSGYQAYQQGRYENEVARNNAAMERYAAQEAEEIGQRDELRKWREIAQAKSAQIAAFAANGFDTSFGSATDVVSDTLALGREDARIIRDNAGKAARGHLITAQNYIEQGKAAARQGRGAFTRSLFQAGATILGGAGQYMGMQQAGSQTLTGFTAPTLNPLNARMPGVI